LNDNAASANIGVSSDAYLSRFSTDGNLIWSTYFGGEEFENCNGVSCSNSGDNIFITGSTRSTSGVAVNGHQNNYGGGQSDAFLAKFNDLGIV